MRFAAALMLLVAVTIAAAIAPTGKPALATSYPRELSAFRELCVDVSVEATDDLQARLQPGGRADRLASSLTSFVREQLLDLGLLYPVGWTTCFERRGSKQTGQTTLFFHVTLAQDNAPGDELLAAAVVHPMFEDQQVAPHAYPTRLFRCQAGDVLEQCVDTNLKAYFREQLFPTIRAAQERACPPYAIRWRPGCRERQPRYPD